MRRRTFIRSLGVAAVAASTHTWAQEVPAAAGLDLLAYSLGPIVWVRCGGRALTCYRAHATQKYPYFYPVAGPVTGAPLTEESGDPYPHHRSLYIGCDRVNGANYWQEGLERGRIVSRGPAIAEGTAARVVITDACDWALDGREPDVTDTRRFTITAPSAALRLIDAEVTLTAARDVTIERSNHSLFSIRAASDLTPLAGGHLVNSEGQAGEKATFGQPAKWCTFWAERPGGTEGIALMDHPGNPWQPCPWFTRDYGFMSPTPLNWLEEPSMDLPAGTQVSLRYRVVAYAGTPEEAGLAALYDGWAAG